MTRLLSFLLMLANAALAFAVFWLDSNEGQSRMIAVFLAAALAALAQLLLLWPRPAIRAFAHRPRHHSRGHRLAHRRVRSDGGAQHVRLVTAVRLLR